MGDVTMSAHINFDSCMTDDTHEDLYLLSCAIEAEIVQRRKMADSARANGSEMLASAIEQRHIARLLRLRWQVARGMTE
jgi:pyruvate-formate lyase